MTITAKRLKVLSDLGIKPPKTAAQIRQGYRDKALALPRETRQAMLDALHDGATLGDVARAFCVDLDTVCGLININMAQIQFLRGDTA